MDEPHKPSASLPAEAKTTGRRERRATNWWRRLPVFAAGLIIGGGLAWWLWRMPATKDAAATAFTGKFVVYARPPERQSEPQPVEKPGAAPVRAGGNMSLEIQLDPPGFAYCVWFDAAGQVLPLYPWNSQHLEIKDIQEPPPERRPAKLVYSPLLGGGWNFGETTGVETVLLLARQTPLPPAVDLAALLTPLPAFPATPDNNRQVVILGLDPGDTTIKAIHPPQNSDPAAAAEHDALNELIFRLRPHFELIRAVRFPHE